MVHKDALDFYKIIRNSPEMWQDLSAAQDAETMIAKITILSAAQDITLSPEQIRAAMADLPDLIAEATDDDELSDDELELVAAGASDTGNKNRMNP